MDQTNTSSTFIIWVLIFVVVSVWIIARSGRKKQRLESSISAEDLEQLMRVESIPDEYHYERRNLIMTRAETQFFKMLVEALDDKYYVFPQVHLSSIFEHKIHGQDWWKAFHHINRKSVDFVICDKESVSPLIAIELDDWSHQLEKRQKRDEEVERIFTGANMPLLRFGHHGPYTPEKIAESIKSSGVLKIGY